MSTPPADDPHRQPAGHARTGLLVAQDPDDDKQRILAVSKCNMTVKPASLRFALETLAEGNPKDTKVLHELGQHYYENNDSDKAVDVYTRITALNPADLVAIKRGKDAAARASLAKRARASATSGSDGLMNLTATGASS